MKLTKIAIRNFRSIKDEQIEVKDNCLILVGKNEAGKTNTLRAIAGGLDKEAYPIKPKDKRKKLTTEDISSDNYYIKYTFELTKDEMDDIFNQFNLPIYDNVFEIDGKSLSVIDFANRYFRSGVYHFDINKQSGSAKYFTIADEKKIKIIKNLYKVKTAFNDTEGNSYAVNQVIENPKGYESYVNELTLEHYGNLLYPLLTMYIKSNLPAVYYWSYSSEYLLPNSVAIESFKTSPQCCIPLKNIFELAGFNDIKTAFVNAYTEDGDYINLLSRVSEIATKNFEEKWEDLKGVKIDLSPDGTDIRIKVKEKCAYNMEDRSDGFKKFVSILLMLSTQVECGEIENCIILIDEPDNSLYPTGAKYLRDELINISEKNYVIYSTHSPFMIDKHNIERHIMVKKENDITTFQRADSSKYADDEVLLNAIGTSSFEYLKENNIIFEGWSDCRFFNTALKSKSTAHKELLQFFKDLGTAYSHGAPDIKNLTPLLMLANKNVVIFTDSDNGSNEAKKSYKKNNGYKNENWFTFENLGGSRDETIEDYIGNEDLLQKALEHIGHTEIDFATRGDKKIMKFLERLDKDDKERFKGFLIKKLTYKDIKEEYFSVILKTLHDKIKGI